MDIMSEMKYKIIPFIIYPFDVMVISDGNYKHILKLLRDRLPKDCYNEIDLLNDEYDAKTVRFKNGATCIVLNKTDNATIAHESFHAVCYLMEAIGIELDHNSSEAYAYALGYLVNEINTFLGV